jgi:hypothetical protein
VSTEGRLTGVQCHHCGSDNDGYTAVAGGSPSSGDALVCIYCGRLSILLVSEVETYSARAPSLEEEAQFQSKIPTFLPLIASAYDHGFARGAASRT